MDNDRDPSLRRLRPMGSDEAASSQRERARDGTWSRDGRMRDGRSAGESSGMRARSDGIRRVRIMSNWTAAALLVGTGAGAAALASHSFSTGTSASGVTYSTQGAGTQGTSGAPTTSGPHVGGTVVTSGGSGATVSTTTRVVNGKTVVTQVRHPAAYHDN